MAAEYLHPFQEAEVDTLILGCTHYPLMSDLIQRTVGPGSAWSIQRRRQPGRLGAF